MIIGSILDVDCTNCLNAIQAVITAKAVNYSLILEIK